MSESYAFAFPVDAHYYHVSIRSKSQARGKVESVTVFFFKTHPPERRL